MPLRRSLVGFHERLAFLAQVILFVVLGLFVFPSRLAPVAAAAAALALALALVARPVAVGLLTAFQGFTLRERALLGWAGLRGAVPIVLATFALSEGVAASATIFNAVFFVVLVSALLQGLTLEPVARRLRLTTEARPFYEPPVEVGVIRGLGGDVVEHSVAPGDAVVGTRVRDLGLPREALVMFIVRGEAGIPPRGSTRVEAGDLLSIVATARTRDEVARLRRVWVQGPLPPGRAGGL
jgi:cell volume regulation protein A